MTDKIDLLLNIVSIDRATPIVANRVEKKSKLNISSVSNTEDRKKVYSQDAAYF